MIRLIQKYTCFRNPINTGMIMPKFWCILRS
nr:MAG TPA: hypothetical protein [Caudoviricetes sp.]